MIPSLILISTIVVLSIPIAILCIPWAVFTGNVGCLLQIARHLRERQPGFWVAHPIDALWAAYSGELPLELRA